MAASYRTPARGARGELKEAIRRKIQPPEVTLVGADYGERGVSIELEVHEERCDDLSDLLFR